MYLETFVFSALLLLLVTSVSVVLFKHIGLGSVLGLLVAGIVVGPHSPGPGLTGADEAENLRSFAELGVVLLLFLIGLEMKPSRLWRMRAMVFGMGSLQILLTGAVLAFYAHFQFADLAVAALFGATLALSSTAFVMQLLQERGEIASPQGNAAFAVLLMQDLAIVPLLALVPILSHASSLSAEVSLLRQIAIVLAMLAVVLVVGLLVLPRVLDHLARQANREAFFLVVMLSVFLAAWAMHRAGLSMALGVFVMGMLLSGSRYNLQIRAVIEPYKGLMMSLFFVAVGMSVDIGALAEQPWLLLQHALVIIMIKLAVMLGLALAFGLPGNVSVRMAFLLAQGGEFGFVLFGAARALDVIDEQIFVLGVGVISLSMLATPLLARLGERLGQMLERRQELGADLCFIRHLAGGGEVVQPRVVVAGYGRVGHTVGTLLKGSAVPFIAFDTDPERVAAARREGFPVFYGDIADPELLSGLNMDEVQVVVLSIAHMPTALRVASHLRNAYPSVTVVARARDLEACGHLVQAGVTRAFPEIIESSLKLAATALEFAGLPEDNVDHLMSDARSENYQLVRQTGPSSG